MVLPAPACGIIADSGEGFVGITYSHAKGVREYRILASQLPPFLAPESGESHGYGVAVPSPDSDCGVEIDLVAAGISGIASVPVPGATPPVLFWAGLTRTSPLTDREQQALERVAQRIAGLAQETASNPDYEQLRRLEAVNRLLPALLSCPDLPGVLDWLAAIGRSSLRHDGLTIGIFSDDLASLTIHHPASPAESKVVPQPRSSAAIARALEYDIVDEQVAHAVAGGDGISNRLQSSLHLPLRFGDRVLGRLEFHCGDAAAYGRDDVIVGRRVADLVAIAIDRIRLAEESRRTAALLAREAALDHLDALLGTITGVLDVREVFDRIFEISQKVLPHDAMSIAVPMADSSRVILYATTGALRHLPVPWEQSLRDVSLVERSWDFVLIDDLPLNPVYAPLPSVKAGMRSLVIIPVRLDEQLRAWVNFWSAAPRRFAAADIPAARRIAAHITLTFSHQRLAEQALVTQELRARATNLDLLDEVLAPLVDSSNLQEVFEKASAVARKILNHDAALLVALTADGSRARIYASNGFPPALSSSAKLPEELLRSFESGSEILDDLTQRSEPLYGELAGNGLRSLLRVAIDSEEAASGILILFAITPAAFKSGDVAVARRMADRINVTLSRERVIQVSRRADEATARAARLEARVRQLMEELDTRTGYRHVVGESPQWRQVLTQAAQVAPTDATVLLLGESGTGKEVAARFVHRGSSRSNGPFVALNCAALPEHLLEAELFGYERGAYTGAVQSKPGQLERQRTGAASRGRVGFEPARLRCRSQGDGAGDDRADA